MTQRYQWNKAWRYRHPAKRQAGKGRYYQKHRDTLENSRNARRWWTAPEIALITAPNRPPDSVLAKQLGRSVQAIQIKRGKVVADS